MPRSTYTLAITRADLRAIAIAEEELHGYVSAVGREDEQYDLFQWALRRLAQIADRAAVDASEGRDADG